MWSNLVCKPHPLIIMLSHIPVRVSFWGVGVLPCPSYFDIPCLCPHSNWNPASVNLTTCVPQQVVCIPTSLLPRPSLQLWSLAVPSPQADEEEVWDWDWRSSCSELCSCSDSHVVNWPTIKHTYGLWRTGYPVTWKVYMSVASCLGLHLATLSDSMADVVTKGLKLGATRKSGNWNHGVNCIIVLLTHGWVVWRSQFQ